jgi:prophage tail gpP-like protein
MITMEINGQQYTEFQDITVQKSLDDLSGSFTFTAITSPDFIFPFHLGDMCLIFAEDELILTGFIEKMAGEGSVSQQQLSISGRELTCDVVDSTIGKNIEYNAGITLTEVIIQTLAKQGITGIQVINNVSGLDPFAASEIVTSQKSQSVFDFIESYARKRQVILTSTPEGNILITRAATQLQTDVIISREFDDINGRNNVLQSNWVLDASQRFNTYVFSSQSNVSTLNIFGGTSSKKMILVNSKAIDNEIRPTRVYNGIAESSSDEPTCKDRASWESSLRKARAITYSATVPEYRHDPNDPSSTLWKLNTLVNVVDDYADINSNLLVNNITYFTSVSGARTTELSLVIPESYTLQEEIEAATQNTRKKSRKIAAQFNFVKAYAGAEDVTS